MEWADDVANRPRRANAGSRLHELLQKGLDEEDEQDLLQLDQSSSDTSFTLGSDEEAMDEIDSDFDAEEVAGVLEGEAVETEITVRRAERQERQRERQKRLQRTQNFAKAAAHDRAAQKRARERQKKKNTNKKFARDGKIKSEQTQRKRQRRDTEGSSSSSNSDASGEDGSDDADGDEDAEDIDLRQRVRRRPVPTIPCAQRLEEAHRRAAARRAAQAAVAEEAAGEDGTGAAAAASMLHAHRGLNVGKTRPRPRRGVGGGVPRRGGGVRFEDVAETVGDSRGEAARCVPYIVSPRIALYAAVPQRIGYSSGVSILERFKTPTVLSFSESLPPAFQTS